MSEPNSRRSISQKAHSRFQKVFSLTKEPLTDKQLTDAMNLNIITGTGAILWYMVCFPGSLLNVFFKNYLGASSFELGILVMISQLSAVLNLFSIILYSKCKTRKLPWFIFNIIHRCYAFLLAAGAIYVARGGDHGIVIKAIIAGMAINWTLATLSTTGWWTWQTDLYPDKIRATFFGRRSAVLGLANMVAFFVVTIALDTIKFIDIYYVFAIFFTLAGIFGLADIVFHALIPEPCPKIRTEFSWKNVFEPLRNRNFMRLVAGFGMFMFASSIFSPFLAPYITSSNDIGAPNTWLGVMFAVSLGAWICVAGRWGKIMDRFGRKGVIMIGCFSSVLWLGYIALTPHNYFFVIPVIAILTGLFLTLTFESSNQLMLTISPERNKMSYVAWFATCNGLLGSIGSLAGGKISDVLKDLKYPLGADFALNGFHVQVVLAVGLSLFGLIALRGIEEPQSRSMGFIVRWIVGNKKIV